MRQALLDHLVIFFRDQDLPPARFLALARRFGTPIEYPFVKGIDGFPEIIAVAKLEHERVNFGGVWHSDTTYLEQPPMGTLLVAREVPPVGGDTLFANQYLAYEALSERMRAMLEGLTGVSNSAKADVTRTREDRVKSAGTSQAREVADGRAPGGAHASGNRAQGAVCQYRAHAAFRRHDRGGERRRCWGFCSATRSARSSPAGSAGRSVRWRSGTIAARSTIRSMTITDIGG